MAEAGDILQEFHHAKPPEKVVIVVAVLAIGGIAIYLIWNRNQANAAGAAGASSSQQAGYPTAGGVPVLPSGVNPLFDPNGNLIGFQNPPAGSGSSGSGFQLPTQLSGMKIWQGTTTHQYFFGPNGPQPGRANQTPLASLFPSGTIFGGGTGGQLTYTLPGTTTPINTGITLSNPTPQAPMIASNTQVARTAGGH